MASESSRKRRRADSPVEVGPPIIFASPGLKSDVRLTIFGQIFEVHSVILKLYSKYFREFLDSPDKSGLSASALFKYEYTSVIDEDGTWALEPSAKAPAQTDEVLGRLDPQKRLAQLEAFQKLLSAMYHRPYKIQNPGELEDITNLADFYCTLPIVSSTLIGALFGNAMFTVPDSQPAGEPTEFVKATPKLLLVAQKLRSTVLFRECFVHVVGRWREIQLQGEDLPIRENREICQLVMSEYERNCILVMDLNQRLLRRFITGEIVVRDFSPHLVPEGGLGIENPTFFQVLGKELTAKGWMDKPEDTSERKFMALLDDLLANELGLDCTGYGPGDAGGPYETYLLCSQVHDEGMPWDKEQIDW